MIEERISQHWRVIVVASLLLALAAIGVFSLTSRSTNEPITDGLSQQQLQQRSSQIISSFENSTTNVQYDYSDTLDDGRGITAGRAGFTSGTGDLLEVVEQYDKTKPQNTLERYLPALRRVNNTSSVAGLEGFADAWKQAAKDSEMRDAQDDVYGELYFDPAMVQAQKAGITSNAGKLILLDTIIQQGGGNDADSLGSIIKQTDDSIGPASKTSETKWLQRFLEIRRQHLQNAADPDTREAWRQSIDRVTALASILKQDTSLRGDLQWQVYGDKFSLPATK